MVYWSKQNDLERWLSGRKQRFAKASYGLNRTEGSNPSLSANFLANGGWKVNESGWWNVCRRTRCREFMKAGEWNAGEWVGEESVRKRG